MYGKWYSMLISVFLLLLFGASLFAGTVEEQVSDNKQSGYLDKEIFDEKKPLRDSSISDACYPFSFEGTPVDLQTESSQCIPGLKWNEIYYTETRHDPNYWERVIRLKMNPNATELFCYVYVHGFLEDGSLNSYTREKIFNGEVVNDYIALMKKLEFAKFDDFSEDPITDWPENTNLEGRMFVIGREETMDIAWRHFYSSQDCFKNDEDRIALVDMCRNLADEVDVMGVSSGDRYDFSWRRVSIRSTQITWGGSSITETISVQIDSDTKQLVCSYDYSRYDSTEIHKKMRFNTDAYDYLTNLVSQAEVYALRLPRNEQNRRMDCGFYHTLGFSMGGNLEYFVYTDPEALYTSDFIIHGETAKLIALLTYLGEKTKNA